MLRRRISAGLLVWLSALWPLQGAAEPTQLTIGALAFAGDEQVRRHWQPTLSLLQARFPAYRFALRPLSLAALDAAVAAGELDFLVTNPVQYAELEYRYHVARIAMVDEDQPVASTLVTNNDELRSFADLAGKRLAVVSTEALGGFRALWREIALSDAALPDRIELLVAGYPMQAAAAAVLDGRADAAVLRTCLLERWQQQEPQRYGALRAFALYPGAAGDCASSSRSYPGWPMAKTRDTDPVLAKQVAIALFQMTSGNRWTVPVDYHAVHELLRELQLGPYARSGRVSLQEVIEDYREWFFVFAALILSWGIYSVRIESLVRQRTRELRVANAGLTREIAERQRAEEADRLHRRELEHVARLSILGEMASSIAHELNQPLNAITLYAQGCLMRLESGRFEAQDMRAASREIVAQAERAALVTKRIRAFVRKRERQLTALAPAELVQECAGLFEAATRRAGVAVTLDLAPDLPTILADRIQLQQVLLNLIQNAIDAMNGAQVGQRAIALCGRPYTDPQRGAGVCLSVRDFGCGLDAAGLARFAEPFLTTKPDGIGLGLALSRSIIEAHDGWLRAKSPQDGPGLEVFFWLPAEDS
ncbi:PhnD/SsuA/transferrin family substrate-binding protein [Granulosicoccaceae sp. 1_MG-2023]|nr:PhnD/SsuA/transferrin family substrate-binding protein [Granulosicoccaceae sp. 1_MG-2023]